MNKTNYIWRALLIVTVLFLGSCIKQDFGIPEALEIPAGHVITVNQLRDICPPGNVHKFQGDTSLVLVVSMDDKSGNLYKEAYAQDETGGILLRLTSPGGLYQGDSILLNLNGLTVQYYRKAFQIDSVSVDKNVLKMNVGVNVEPQVITISELMNSWEYEAELIKINNVQFIQKYLDGTYADAENLEYGEITIEDELGNTAMVRTSGYAKFASEIVPEGKGSLTAIVSRYSDVIQLLIRRAKEVEFDNERGESYFFEGTGTFDDPFSVGQAIDDNSGNGVWVEGYLVGVYETTMDPFTPTYIPPFSTNSNVLIASSPSATSLSGCLVIQLPGGNVRNAINLVNHSANLGKKIKLRGNLTKYFSVPGMRDTDGYWLDDTGIIPDDDDSNSGGETPFFSEEFKTNISAFTAHNVMGAQVWKWDKFDDGCAAMSGHTGSHNPNEDWLVTPQIDLTSRSDVQLLIREAINFSTVHDDVQVFISTDYDGTSLPTESGTWEKLSVTGRASGSNWTFVNCKPVDLSAYDGKKIHIGFRYESFSNRSATWQISKVMLYEK